MNQEKKTESMAILVDIENLIVGVGKLGLPIDIGKVVTKLRGEYSDLSIRIRRAYGDIYAAVKMLQRHVGEENTKGLHAAIRGNLGENLVQIADTPYLKSKNSADMWLAVDALSIAHTMPGIERFAIVSSDRDYIPLILKLASWAARSSASASARARSTRFMSRRATRSTTTRRRSPPRRPTSTRSSRRCRPRRPRTRRRCARPISS